MAQNEHLPIYQAAFRLVVYLETVVESFSRSHKYVQGTALRELALKSIRLIIRANSDPESRYRNFGSFSKS